MKRLVLLAIILMAFSVPVFGQDPEQMTLEAYGFFWSGDYEAAIDCMNDAIIAFPNDPVLYFERGNMLADVGFYKRALADYDTAIKIYPKYIEALCNRSLVHETLGNRLRMIEDRVIVEHIRIMRRR